MPVRARDLARALAAFGVTLEPPKAGSHWIARRGTFAYPIPLHNALKTEVHDRYVRGVCRAFGIDEADLRKLL